MPTYDYRCRACGHTWEAEHSIKAPPVRQCPACQQDAAERQISEGTSFYFDTPSAYRRVSKWSR